MWLGIVGIPRIIQCENGKEFKGILLILLQKYGIMDIFDTASTSKVSIFGYDKVA